MRTTMSRESVIGCGGNLSCMPVLEEQKKLLAEVLDYVAKSNGLRGVLVDKHQARIRQVADGKSILISAHLLESILFRTDSNGTDFIQVNFTTGKKILITDSLIGFKPTTPKGIDITRIPRVVTTPDVISVFEAIQETLHSAGPESYELSILKKIFDAVLSGGEAVGFDLSQERLWLSRVPLVSARATS